MGRRRIRTSNSDLTKFLRSLSREPGFTITQPRSGHYHVNLNGKRVAVMGASPTDAHTAIKNTAKKIFENTGRNVHG
jgi:hypothetical protein